MMIAHMTDGRWIIGIEERNIELLKQGRPLIIKFSEVDMLMEDACLIYGATIKDVENQLKSMITENTLIIDRREQPK